MTSDPQSRAQIHHDEAPHLDAVRRRDAILTRDALAMLPDLQRQVLVMSYFENLTHAQIAHLLVLPLPRVHVSAASGLRTLATALTAATDPHG